MGVTGKKNGKDKDPAGYNKKQLTKAAMTIAISRVSFSSSKEKRRVRFVRFSSKLRFTEQYLLDHPQTVQGMFSVSMQRYTPFEVLVFPAMKKR